MKKTLLVILTVVLVLSCAISSLAWSVTEMDFDQDTETYCDGFPINSKDCNMGFRYDWTPSRNTTNDCNNSTVGDGTWNDQSVVYEDADYGEFVAKFVAPQYMVNEFDSMFTDGYHFEFTLKKDVTNGFAGVAFNYGIADRFGFEQGVDTTNLYDYFFTEYPAASQDGTDAAYVMATGMGFTFLKNDNNKIRFYVHTYTAEGETDVIYYDYDAGADLTADYSSIGYWYYEGEVIFTVNDKVACAIVYNGEGSVSKVAGETLSGTYCKKASIIAGGEEKAKTESALISTDTTIAIALSGEGTTMYCAGWTVETDTDEPEFPSYDKPGTTPAPATEAPASEAPATATPAPATEAPATEAPATEAPATSGCGSMIAGTTMAVLALAGVVVFKKKEN